MISYEPLKTDNDQYYPIEATGKAIATRLYLPLQQFSSFLFILCFLKAAGWAIAAIAILQIPAWGAWVVYYQKSGSTLMQVSPFVILKYRNFQKFK